MHLHYFAFVVARFDSIQALGINTVLLMPTYDVGGLNSFGSPYCIKDYKSVNPDMESLGQLKLLVKEAHKLWRRWRYYRMSIMF